MSSSVASIVQYLLVKQSPEDRKWEEHDADTKQQPHVVHKVFL